MFFCLFSGLDRGPIHSGRGFFLKSSYRGCWCEETLGGKNKDLHYFILVFFLLPAAFASKFSALCWPRRQGYFF